VPTALDVVDGEVRELIRRRGLDPFVDPAPVRLLVRDVVADYSERSLTSALPPIADVESVVRDVLDRVAGFGPLQRYLDDPAVEEIWVNHPADENAQLRRLVSRLSPQEVRRSTKNVSQHRRRRLPRPVLRGRPQVAVDVQGE
jgi:Flp pilus assembly CpaF family ATPase